MLRTETVSPGTLELLKQLMADSTLNSFFLAGGTGLSLQIGHRISVDLDLFMQQSFDENVLSEYLEKGREFQLRYLQKDTIKGQIANVQVDLIAHTYPLVNNLILEEGVRMASLYDIAAMKLNAIIGNGTRLKDYIDIAFLSQHISFEQMTDAYQKKYSSRNPVLPAKALAWHNDINFDEPIRLVNGKYEWKKIEKRINEMIRFQGKVFGEF